MKKISRKGFTLIEITVTLVIFMTVSGFFISFIQFSPFFGNLDELQYLNTTKKITSDLESFFIQYPINSGSIVVDAIPSRYFDRVGLAYSGGTLILWVADRNTNTLLDQNSNDIGFLSSKQQDGNLDAAAFTGTLENISDHIEILSFKGSVKNNLLRMEMLYRPTGSDTMTPKIFLYSKNLNP